MDPTRMSLVFERPGSDIKKAGYLKKLKTMKKKFFLMRSTSSSGPARLEYYDSEKKFRNGQIPKRVIHLHLCFNINKKSDTRTKNAIALYTREECFSVIADNAMDQDHWLELLLEYQTEYSDGLTVSPRIHFDYVWQVAIKQRGLGNTIRGMSGTYRMCLSNTDICLVRNNSYIFEFTFQLSSIRRCGHSDGYFFMDVGRSAPTGEGELWIQVDDTVIAQSMHEVILTAMRMSSGGETCNFRQRSSTNSSVINRTRDSAHDFNGQSVLRPRTGSEGKGSPRRRPVSSLSYQRSPNTEITSHIPSQPALHSGHSLDNSIHHYENELHPHAELTFPGHSGQGHGGQGIPGQGHGGQGIPGQGHRFRSDSSESHSSHSSQQMALSPEVLFGTSPAEQVSHRSMTPECVRPPITEESSYFDMSPGVRSTTPSPPHHYSSESYPHPYSSDMVVSDAIVISGAATRDGYIEMKPGSSVGSSTCGNDTGYMDMAINTPHDKVDSSYMMMGHHGNRQSTISVPIPTRGPNCKEPGYMDMNMTPTSQTLPTVKEGGSGESYLPMTPTGMSPRSASELKPTKVISYLSDDSMSGEFPKRAYSLGSRPVSKTLHRHTHVPEPPVPMDLKVTDNGRSSSAPHLIIQKIKNQSAAYMPMDSSNYSASVKSDDSDSFMELDFYRPRTASESFGYRPRASSFGKMYNTQGHRPRSSSYGQSSRGGKQLGSFESVRTTSKELLHKRSFESLGRFSTTSSKASSSESLRKLETSSKSSQQSDYVDMNMNRNADNSGYIDMTIGVPGQGSKCSGTSRSSSSQSLSSSPAISGFVSPSRPEKSSPDIKIIKASGHVVQKPVGLTVSHHSGGSHNTDGIPSQAALFSPVAFNSGSRSPSVKGRSPASSGRESEEESYVPYQPASSDRHSKDVKQGLMETANLDMGKLSLKKKKHKNEKNDKKSAEKQKKEKDLESKKVGRTSPKDGRPSPKIESKFQKTTSVQDDVYLEYEPGLTLAEVRSPLSDAAYNEKAGVGRNTSTPKCDVRDHEKSGVIRKPESVMSHTAKTMANQPEPISDYLDFQPGEVTQDTNDAWQDTVLPSEKMDKSTCEKSSQIDTTGKTTEVKSDCDWKNTKDPSSTGKSERTEPVTFTLGSDSNYMTHAPLSGGGDHVPGSVDTPTANEEVTPTNPAESYQYMDFDPANHQVKEGEVKNPTRVRSYIANQAMEAELKGNNSVPNLTLGSVNQENSSAPISTLVSVKSVDNSASENSAKIAQNSSAGVEIRPSSVETTKPAKISDKQPRTESPIRVEKSQRDKSKAKEKHQVELKSVSATVLPVHEEEDDGYVGLDFTGNSGTGDSSPVDVDNLRPLPVRSEISSQEGLSKVVMKRLMSVPGADDSKTDITQERQVVGRKVSSPALGQYHQNLASNVRMSPVRKGSVSSMGEESPNGRKEEESCDSTDGKVSGGGGGSELHKQNSMPCMTIADDLPPPPSPAIGNPGFTNNARSRHSCSDLTGAYEQMSFPAGSNLESGHQQSSSQQQLVVPSGEAQLNYASLDLGSSETVDSNDPKSPRIKSRHPSSADEATGPTLSYAQIDFKKSENLKNSCNKDTMFSFD